MQLVEVQRVRQALHELMSAETGERQLTSSSDWKRTRFACFSGERVGTVPSGSGGGGRMVGSCCMVLRQPREGEGEGKKDEGATAVVGRSHATCSHYLDRRRTAMMARLQAGVLG